MSKARMLICVLAVLLVQGISLASSVSGPFTTSTPISTTKTDWKGTLVFPQFDATLGTLVAVELKIDTAFDTVLTVTNAASSSSYGTAKTHLTLSVQDPGNNLVAPVLDLLSPNYTYNLDPGQATTSGILTKTGQSDNVYTTSNILSEFQGSGTFALDIWTLTESLLGNTGGNTAVNQVTNASATGTVTYYYIPEPATLSLLGLGIVGLLKRRSH